MGGIVLQNSKNGLQRFFREKSNQATIADRCVLERATEVAGEFITSCCGPPHDYSIAAPIARKNLSSVIQKEFRNTIGGQADIRHARPQRPIYDGVDAPRRHRCAKVEVLNTT